VEAVNATPEATEETLTRFRLDAIREHVKRIWAAMQGESDRGPTDYPMWDDERKILINIIRKQTEGSRGSSGPGSVNGNSWSTWILGIVGALIVASVLGLTSAMFTMTGRMSTLEAKVDMLLRDRK
jgi:hypothetical protein